MNKRNRELIKFVKQKFPNLTNINLIIGRKHSRLIIEDETGTERTIFVSSSPSRLHFFETEKDIKRELSKN